MLGESGYRRFFFGTQSGNLGPPRSTTLVSDVVTGPARGGERRPTLNSTGALFSLTDNRLQITSVTSSRTVFFLDPFPWEEGVDYRLFSLLGLEIRNLAQSLFPLIVALSSYAPIGKVKELLCSMPSFNLHFPSTAFLTKLFVVIGV